eukprot:m51a1_g7371 hypothetical protein (327) ;mRNA; f:69124-70104
MQCASEDKPVISLVAEYLADTFLPISIAVPRSALSTASSYRTGLFRAWLQSRRSPVIEVYYWAVSTPASDSTPLVAHPAVYAAEHLGVVPQGYFGLEARPEGDEYVLDSQGKLPRRWMLMMVDFWFKHESGARVVPADPEAEKALLRESASEWEARLRELPAAVREALQEAMLYINWRGRCSFRVRQAPPYTLQQVTELLGAKEAEALDDRDRGHVAGRVWCTGDNWCSVPTRAFFRRCERFLSIPKVDIPGWTAPYQRNSACEGGIVMFYDFGPWQQLAPHLGSISDGRCDLRGSDSYCHCRALMPIDELIVLREALKTEGAVVE